MTSKRRSTRKGKDDYKEKSERDLYADIVDTSSSEDEQPVKPVWLQDDNVDDEQVNLSSEDEGDTELNDLIDKSASKREAHGESSDEEEVDDATVSLKLNRLQEFVKQSQVYSGIIADTLLERTEERQSKQKSKQQETAPRKRRKITDFFGKKGHQTVESELSHGQPSLLRNCQLKPYQLEGVNWLITLYENGLNGILADEMGLGKTIQSIALLAFIYEMDTKGPFLIAAPLSTVANWMNEFKRFAPDIPILKYYSSQGQRERHRMLRDFFKKNNGEGVIMTSYEIIIRDIDEILSHQWKFLIVDEGHRLKNINCKLIRELKRINTSNRLLLTGTPLQNNLAELWSLLNFILPDIFADFEIFNKWFDFSDLEINSRSKGLNKLINDELEKNLISNLHTILKPFLLRRLKKNVLADTLPPKKEYIINCPLTQAQRKMYKSALSGHLKQAIFKYAIKEFFRLNQKHIGQVSDKSIKDFTEWKLSDEDSAPSSDLQAQMSQLYEEHIYRQVLSKKLLNMMMQLRQIVNSTFLFFFPYLEPEDLTLESLLKSSGKLQTLQQLVPPLVKAKHRVLIFTQFVNMLDLLEDWCDLNDLRVCRIDGSMDNETRQKEIESFSKSNDDIDIFLISTRAGGLGINLTAADSVILFDSDWNPQVDLQAMDRTHRIGQTKPVVVYRLCCDNTIEHVILTRAANKRKLEKMVIQMGRFNTLKKLALNESTFITTPGQAANTNKNLVNELSQLLLSDESSIGFAKEGNGKLTQEELHVLINRSPETFKREKADETYPHIKLFETTAGFEGST